MSKLKIPLHIQILLGLLLGGAYGYFLPEYSEGVAWLGDLFLRALKMIIIPLLFTSIISGIVSLGGGEKLKSLTLKTVAWYLTTSLLAIITGLILVNLIAPGEGVALPEFAEKVQNLKTENLSLKDFFLRMVPQNIFNAMAKGKMLPTIVFSMLFAISILNIPETPRRKLTDFFNAFFEAMMKLTYYIILFTPIGIFGLLAGIVSKYAGEGGQFIVLVKTLSQYILTVLAGLLIHSMVTIPALMYLLTRKNAYLLLKKLKLVLITAFSTSSSSATMPTTLQELENTVGVPNKYTSFVIPLGATINMDGTALYECVAALFVAQVYGIDLSISQQFLVVFTSLLASIGAAGVPMAGLVMMTVVFSVVGLPLEGIGIVLTVDRILDMFRTTVNVWSDTSATFTIATLETGKDFLRE